MTEPVIADGLQGPVAVADVLILPAEQDCAAVFARWPGLAMVVFRQAGATSVIITRDAVRLTAPTASLMDIIRIVYVWWSVTRQFTQPSTDVLYSTREQ